MQPSEHGRLFSALDTAKWLVKMAVADGVLSPNEVSVLSEFARQNDLSLEPMLDMARRLNSTNRPEVNLVDYSNRDGRDFENHVVAYLKGIENLELLEWTGDKYHQGVYDPRNLNPDLHLRWHSDDGVALDFWIECKWRHHWMKDAQGHFFEMDKEQLRRYRKMAKEQKQKVFVAFATGRTGTEPRSVFIIPLRAFVNARVMRKVADQKYKIDDTPKAFAAAIRRSFTRSKSRQSR